MVARDPAVSDDGSYMANGARETALAHRAVLYSWNRCFVDRRLLSVVGDPCGIRGAGRSSMGPVDAGRTPPTVGCRTRKTEWGMEKDAAWPRVKSVNWEEAATEGSVRPATRSECHRRTRVKEGRSSAQGERQSLGESCETRSGRPAGTRRPAHVEGAARLSVSHAADMGSRTRCEAHFDRPVVDDAQEALRPVGPAARAVSSYCQTVGPTDEAINPGPSDGCPTAEAINPNRQTVPGV